MLTQRFRKLTRLRLPIVALLVQLAHPGLAQAGEDLLGLYVGGSVGQSRIETAWTIPPLPITVVQGPYAGRFDQTAVGFKILAGIRPISFAGAEVAFEDFGHARGDYVLSSLLGPAHVSMVGGSAFGVLYLPLPAPIELFAKAGIATIRSRLTTNSAVQGPCGLCAVVGPSSDLVRTDSNFAAGAGAQWRIGQFSVRLEYERFTAEARTRLLCRSAAFEDSDRHMREPRAGITRTDEIGAALNRQ